MFDHQVAQNIVDETAKICGCNLIITNHLGVIVGATKMNRIGGIHPGLDPLFKGERDIVEADKEEVNLFFPGMRQGIELPIHLHEKVIGTVGVEGHPNEVRNYGGLIKNQVELMYKHYLLNERSGSLLHAQELLISNIISLDIDTNTKTNKLLDLANIIDMDFDLPRVCFVVEFNKMANTYKFNQTQKLLSLQGSIIQFMNASFDHMNHIYSFHGKTKIINFILCKQFEETIIEQIENFRQGFLKKFNIPCNIGIGKSYKGLFGLKKSFDEAITALHLASKFGSNHNGIFKISDLHIEQILNDVAKNTREDILNTPWIQEFTQNLNDQLLETFFCLCKNHLKINQTAKKLYIHRNTLLYRINKIKKITNLDPTHFLDAARLYLILKLRIQRL